jgi:hypothetical protein
MQRFVLLSQPRAHCGAHLEAVHGVGHVAGALEAVELRARFRGHGPERQPQALHLWCSL